MMASRSSQVTSSNGEIPGRVKWREKERPGARLEAERAGTLAGVPVWVAERLFAAVLMGFIGVDLLLLSNLYEQCWFRRLQWCLVFPFPAASAMPILGDGAYWPVFLRPSRSVWFVVHV